MKKLFISFILFFSLIYCSGQNTDTIDIIKTPNEHRIIPNNSIYLELMGQAMGISLNYERIFSHGGDIYISGRVGIGGFGGPEVTLALPLLVNGMYQVSNGFLFELGIGFNPTYTFWPNYYSSGNLFFGPSSIRTFHEKGSFFDPLITGFAGIRVQRKKGFLFRFGFTPLIGLTQNIENSIIYKQNVTTTLFPLWGIDLGYSFK